MGRAGDGFVSPSSLLLTDILTAFPQIALPPPSTTMCPRIPSTEQHILSPPPQRNQIRLGIPRNLPLGRATYGSETSRGASRCQRGRIEAGFRAMVWRTSVVQALVSPFPVWVSAGLIRQEGCLRLSLIRCIRFGGTSPTTGVWSCYKSLHGFLRRKRGSRRRITGRFVPQVC